MELRGKKVTHDFLSLYPPESSFQLQDPRSSSQGFYLKTRDFLQPLERGSEASGDGGRIPTERVFAGACSVVGHVGDAGTNPAAAGGAVAKPGTSSAAVRAGFPVGLEAKPEPDYCSRSTTTSYGSHAGGGVSYTLWDDKDTACRGQWSSSLSGARGGSGGGCSGAISAFAGRNISAAPEKKRLVEAVTSRSSNFDDEEEVFVKREEGSLSRKDLVDGQANSDQRPNTPRSKHSATEQRRRSKINDRFQILREIIPHSDQKRDKASFLHEVIEYIRFLQEKVQKHESSYSTWNQDHSTKLMPWKNSQAPANGIAIPSQVVKCDPSPPHMFSKKSDGRSVPVVTAGNSSYETMETPISFPSNLAAAADRHNLIQPRLIAIGKEIDSTDHPQQRSIQTLNQDSMAFQDQSPWRSRSFRPAGDEQEELTVDDGTISVSTAYSNGLLNALAQTLQRSGVDLSQASIAVQINLGRKAINRRPAAAAATTSGSAMKDPRNPSSIYQAAFGYSRTGNGNEQSQAPPKRRRVGQ